MVGLCSSPSLWERLTQKSHPERQTETALSRDLNLFDVSIQGITHMVGGTILVTTPLLIRDVAGPSLCLSYLVSGLIMIFTLLSYMDLSSRYTCIGNAFVYAYTAVCELAAVLAASLIIGENLLTLPFLLKGFSATFDSLLLNGTFLTREHAFFRDVLHMGFLRFDTIAVVSIIVVILINLFPIRRLAMIVNATVITSVVILLGYDIIALVFGSPHNFTSATNPVNGKSGMFPYGYSGFVKGTAISMNAYGSVEIINSLAEETVNPRRTIPLAFALSLTLVCVLYMVTTFCIAYLQPWYSIQGLSGLVGTLSDPRLHVYKWVVGAMVLTVSLVHSIVALTGCSRILYKTAVDGLSFKVLKRVGHKSRAPYISVITIGILAIISCSLLTYDDLVNMTSAQQIIIYVVVNAIAIIKTYHHDAEDQNESYRLIRSSEGEEEVRDLKGLRCRNNLLYGLVGLYLMHCLAFSLVFRLLQLTPVTITILTLILVSGTGLLFFIYYRFPRQEACTASFRCPLMPFTPGLGIFFNMVLVGSLSLQSLYAIIVSAVVGLAVYFSYGVFHSEVTRRKQGLLEELSE